MKEKIFKLLGEKFPTERKDGLEHIATSLALCATEETADELVGKLTAEAVSGTIKEWRKKADAENAKAIENWKKNHPDPTPTPTPAPTPTDKNTPPNPTPQPAPQPAEPSITAEAIAKMVSDGIAKATEQLTAKIGEFEAKEVAANRISQVEKLLEDMPASYRELALSAFHDKKFESEDAFKEYLTSTKEGADKFRQEMTQQGLKEFSFATPKSVNPHDAPSADVQEFIKNNQDNPLGGKKL